LTPRVPFSGGWTASATVVNYTPPRILPTGPGGAEAATLSPRTKASQLKQPKEVDLSALTVAKPPPTSTTITTGASAGSSMLIQQLRSELQSVQSQLTASANALAAKNLRVKQLQKEKEQLVQEKDQARKELEREREKQINLQQKQQRSSSVASIGSAPPTASAAPQQPAGRSYLTSKRLKESADLLASARLTINKLTLALDAARRRLRLKIGKALPEGVKRQMREWRERVKELEEQLEGKAGENTSAGGGGKKSDAFTAQLEMQHTLDEQNALIDSLQAQLLALSREKRTILRDLDHGDHLHAESKFIDGPPEEREAGVQEEQDTIAKALQANQQKHQRAAAAAAAQQQQQMSASSSDPLGDSMDEDQKSHAFEPQQQVHEHRSIANSMAPTPQPHFPLQQAAMLPQRLAGKSNISPPSLEKLQVHSLSTSTSHSPRQASVLTEAYVNASADLTSQLVNLEAARKTESQHTQSIIQAVREQLASVESELQVQKSLVQQYAARHSLSDRLVKSQYAQLCALTREYHLRGEIVHGLTTKLKQAQEEADWTTRELQELRALHPLHLTEEEQREEHEITEGRIEMERKEADQRREQEVELQHQQQQWGEEQKSAQSIPPTMQRAPSYAHSGAFPQPQVHLLHQPQRYGEADPQQQQFHALLQSQASTTPTISALLLQQQQQAPPPPQPRHQKTLSYHSSNSPVPATYQFGPGAANNPPAQRVATLGSASPIQRMATLPSSNPTASPLQRVPTQRINPLLLNSLAAQHAASPAYPANYRPPGNPPAAVPSYQPNYRPPGHHTNASGRWTPSVSIPEHAAVMVQQSPPQAQRPLVTYQPSSAAFVDPSRHPVFNRDRTFAHAAPHAQQAVVALNRQQTGNWKDYKRSLAANSYSSGGEYM
jgi:hypothetical protein